MKSTFEVGPSRQRSVYETGFYGKNSLIPQNFSSLELLGKSKLPKRHFDYIYTGAGGNTGISNNRKGFLKYEIVPRMLSGVHEPNLEIQLLDLRLKFPVLFAPVGVLELAHPFGDLEVARASLNSEIPMIISNQSSFAMEEICTTLKGSNSFFQLYFSRSNSLTESFVKRAERCGCKGIVLTVDTTSLGWRNLDLENGYLPFLEGRGIANYTADPVFQELMEAESTTSSTKQWPSILSLVHLYKSYPDSFLNNILTGNPIKAVRTFVKIYSRPELSWEDVAWLRSVTKLPMFIKGILHEEDAIKAVEAGMDGIIVSNHGGRQVDRVLPSIVALQNIKTVVPPSYPLILDSGIRSGADIFIALAAGASAVCIGRPYVYAMSLAGYKGIQELMMNYLSELNTIMSLCGCARIEDITSNHVRKNTE